MKKLFSLLIGGMALVNFAACDPDTPQNSVEITSLSVTPQEVSLKVGETQQLTATWEPQTATPEVTYESDKAEVASVDADGLITAVAEGEANITVKADKYSVVVKVSVLKEGSPSNTSELPLDKFIESGEGYYTDDPEIVAYETALGRERMELVLGALGPHAGFANESLSTISGAVYGRLNSRGDTINFAVCKEPVQELDKAREMLKHAGFSNITLEEQPDFAVAYGNHDTMKGYQVTITDIETPEIGGKSLISLTRIHNSRRNAVSQTKSLDEYLSVLEDFGLLPQHR